jgi:hypothetical protein
MRGVCRSLCNDDDDDDDNNNNNNNNNNEICSMWKQKKAQMIPIVRGVFNNLST